MFSGRGLLRRRVRDLVLGIGHSIKGNHTTQQEDIFVNREQHV